MYHNTIPLLDELISLIRQNNWRGIYDRFAPIGKLKENPEIWSNDEILNKIAFACAKLAETSSIPDEIFKDIKAKTTFLKQQKKYRQDTELLRKRCIELNPNEAGYHSNLAYLYYQNIHELRQPKGRRDSNLRNEVESFLAQVSNALKIQPDRINDLYRKGYVLVNILPDLILYNKSYESEKDFYKRSEKANSARNEGIENLKQAKKEWESLRNRDDLQKRYKKDYIKALYSLSSAYYNKIKQDWDESVYLLNLNHKLSESENLIFDQFDFDNINHSIEFLKKCCLVDSDYFYNLQIGVKPKSLLEIASQNGIIEGVHKLYTIGKTFLAKYWILSYNGLQDNQEAIEAREIAERYLSAALKCKWSDKNARQNKWFIMERLGRLYITKGECEKAANLFDQNLKNRSYIDPYIAHTYSLSLIKTNRNDESQRILNSISKSRGNKETWVTHFMIAISYFAQNKIQQAQNELDSAITEAQKIGKKNLDSLFLAKSFVEYKLNNMSYALQLLEKAREINPSRLATIKHHHLWKLHQENHLNRKKVILIVDDDYAFRLMFLRFFEKNFSHAIMEILTAKDGEEALEIINGRSGTIDILSTDLAQPKLGGWELMNITKKEYPHIKIIVCTACASILDDEAKNRFLHHNKIIVLNKPIDWDDYSKIITEMLCNVEA